MGTGFALGKRSLRGTTSRGMFDGGEQESSLAGKFRQDAGKLYARWPVTASLLHDIAKAYDYEAKVHDSEADWRDQFES